MLKAFVVLCKLEDVINEEFLLKFEHPSCSETNGTCSIFFEISTLLKILINF